MKKASGKGTITDDGRSRRDTIRRHDLGVWQPETRQRSLEDLLQASSVGRVPKLLPLKWQRMSVSPFTYFRGAAAVMAYDLSRSPHTGILTQLCGDAHIENLGAYAGVDGKLIFDINDFDETIRGPFEWDVKRMATSILLAGQQAGMRAGPCRASAAAFLSGYCELVRTLARMPVLAVARYPVRRIAAAAPLAKLLVQAERASPKRLQKKLTEPAKSGRVFRPVANILWRVHGKEKEQVLESLLSYRKSLLPERQHFLDQFRAIDVAFKVVGTGSVGLRDYCIYMEGNGPADPLFLQVKEEVKSVYAEYLPHSSATEQHQGQRVADGERAMQLQSDPMLGWARLQGDDYLVRQLNDHKATLDATTLNAAGLTAYSRVCGEMLARGHARAGEARVIAGYIGRGQAFTTAMLKFALSYSEQTGKDWKRMKAEHEKDK